MTRIFFKRVPSGREESWDVKDLVESWCKHQTADDYYDSRSEAAAAEVKALRELVAMLLPAVQSGADPDRFRALVEKLIPYSVDPASLDIRLEK